MMKKGILIAVALIFNLNLLVAQKEALWEFKTKDRVYASALVLDNSVYFGSGDHSFYAVNKQTGKKIWEFKTDGAVHSTAATYQGLIYFGSADGNLYALNRATGSLVWKFASEGEKSNGLWDYYLSSPKVDTGKVYWGSGDGHLYAINGTSGALEWKYSTGDIVHASAAINGDKVYIGSFDGFLYALNKENGTLVWKFKTVGDTYFPKGEIQRAALIHDGMVYFGSRDYNIYALNAETGTGSWNMKDAGGWIIATPMVSGDHIYFGTSDAHVFYAMHKKYGKVLWKKSIPLRAYGAAVAHNGLAYFGTFDGKLLGLDLANGDKKWEFQTQASAANYTAIYNDEGHFKKGFELYGENYEAAEAQIHTLGSILSTPVVQENVLFFGSSDGNFYAVAVD